MKLILCFIILAAMNCWCFIALGGTIDPAATDLWQRAAHVWHSPFYIGGEGIAYPQWLFYVAILLYPICVKIGAITIHMISAILVSWMETLILQDLLSMRIRPIIIILMLMLICSNPIMIGLATGGDGFAWVIFGYAMLGRCLFGLIRYGDVRAMMATGLCCAMAVLIDVHLFYIIVAFIPFSLFLAPSDMMKTSPWSFYLILFFPLLAIIGGMIYVNEIFGGTFHGLIASVTGRHMIAKTTSLPDIYKWLIGIAVVPLIALPSLIFRREQLLSLPLIFLIILPVLAALMALDVLFPNPATMLYLFVVPIVMCALIILARHHNKITLLMLSYAWICSAFISILLPPPAMKEMAGLVLTHIKTL